MKSGIRVCEKIRCLYGVVPRIGFSISVAVVLASLFGCAGPAKKLPGQTFWPDVDLPRVELLMTVNSNQDILEKPKGVSLVSLGDYVAPDLQPFIKLNRVVAHKGKIYVCDQARAEVFILDFPNKTFEQLKGNFGRGKLIKPLGIALDKQDNLYVADVKRQDIAVFSPEGNYLSSLGRSAESHPTDVAVDDSYVYLLDTKRHVLELYDIVTGKLSHTIGKDPERPGENLYYPLGLGLDSEGFVYVTNMASGRIIRYDRDGHMMQTYGGGLGTNPSHFARPRDIDIDEDGNLYIVDASHQNVQMFNQQGQLLMYFGSPESMSGPAGVAVTTENIEYYQKFASSGFDLEKVVFVANHFDNRLSVFGFGKLRGVNYEEEYAELMRIRTERLAAEQAGKPGTDKQ
jgi:DNA-binding beta-propeller fold protein YncE